ncbi:MULTISPECIES: DUF3618 domain-containing protein [unclassified Aeromicrobium]|uniref:DUF3618 domain-containing protein n=1 Tax=unclassified Aeromicrobium TaxID=2633570 RepID=UPI0006FBA3BF|nr:MULTISPECIES: DUF3618 domain-containing protein [unclassified Aeromicrobium]KQP28022.1 hypothetical protein ASF38_04410 [Aeromicrobium sp. Leaf272]KQP83920.1 hypothetical protein ASF35_02875 [Aeromicrobium sp. Leaf291]RYY42203.1 MAG: DUF3618 domain-containing protein [Actinomycetales bacterium]
MSERDQLEAEIAATREHLAETVDALGDKLDVKSRAQDAVAEADKGRIAVLAGAAVAAVVGIVLLRRG